MTGGEAVLRMTVTQSFRNLGKEPAILFKLTDIVAVHFSRTEADSRQGRYVYSRQMGGLAVMGQPQWVTAEPGEFFYIIREGGAVDHFGRRVLVILDAVGSPSKPVQPRLKPGSYYLRVEVDPWREERKLGKKLAKRWRPWGHVAVDTIVSEPVPIAVNPGGALPQCKRGPLLRRIR